MTYLRDQGEANAARVSDERLCDRAYLLYSRGWGADLYLDRLVERAGFRRLSSDELAAPTGGDCALPPIAPHSVPE